MSIFLDIELVTGDDLTPENVLTVFKGRATSVRDYMAAEITWLFNFMWNNPKFSPTELFQKLGSDGYALFEYCTALQKVQQATNPAWVWLSPDPKWNISVAEDGAVTVVEVL